MGKTSDSDNVINLKSLDKKSLAIMAHKNKPIGDCLQQQKQLLTKNRYSVFNSNKNLASSAASCDNVDETVTKRVKIPPIVTTLKSKDIIEIMKDNNIVKFNIKIMTIGQKIIFENGKDYETIKKVLKERNNEFFSFTSEENKYTKFVLYGLPNISDKEVYEQLSEVGLTPMKIIVVNPKKSYKSDSGIFIVCFKKGSITLNQLRCYKHVGHTICRWDLQRSNNKNPTQCRRCLMYGHGDNNCSMKVRCNYCSGEHIDDGECPLKNDHVQHKCSNCEGNHVATSVLCPKRGEYLRIRENLNPQRKKYAVQGITQRSQRPPPIDFSFDPRYFPEVGVNSRKPVISDKTWPTQQSVNYASNITTQQENNPNQNNDGLFDTRELLTIFREIVSGLRKCTTREQQFDAIAEMAIKYVGF